MKPQVIVGVSLLQGVKFKELLNQKYFRNANSGL